MRKISLSELERFLFAVSFFPGFLVGVLWVCFDQENWVLPMTLLDPDFLWKIEQMAVDKRALLFLTLGKRLRAFFLLWLFSITSLKRIAVPAFFFVCGMGVGGVMEMLAIHYGLKGLVLYLAMILPHALFYIPGFFILGKLCTAAQREKRRRKTYFILSLGIIIAGVFLESYINPALLKGVVKLLLK